MDHRETAAAQMGGYADPKEDVRPLEEIGRLASDLDRMNGAIADYISRFDGPPPGVLGEAGASNIKPPSSYRSDIERLRRVVEETGSLVDRLTRLG